MHLEILPKLADTLDSAWFALRTCLAGRRTAHLGQALLGLVIGCALAVMPEARAMLLAAALSFAAAEALHRAVTLFAPVRQRAAAR